MLEARIAQVLEKSKSLRKNLCYSKVDPGEGCDSPKMGTQFFACGGGGR
jgi:hypothetical protein